MKRSLLAFLLPAAGLCSGLALVPSTTNVLEVRPDPWPINLQRTIDRRDTSFALEFRDEQVMNGVSLDTLPFKNTGQLRYFAEGLAALKSGHNGDIATYADYTIKRTDPSKKVTYFMVRYQNGLTTFQQPEADKLIAYVRDLK